jgi:surface-anchored protein
MSASLTRSTWFGVLAAVVFAAAASARADTLPIYLKGHADVGLVYEGGLVLHYHIHNGGEDELGRPLEGEFQPNELYTRVPDAAKLVRPAASTWDFLGVPSGSPVWVLPQNDAEVMPFLGFGSEDLVKSDWIGGVSYKLVGVQGPGQVALWTTSWSGSPTAAWQSSDGLNATDSYSMSIPSHGHANWGFTAEGVYQLTIEASGTHLQDGHVSDTETFTFLVGNSAQVPEPGTIALLTSGGVALLVGLRRRRVG